MKKICGLNHLRKLVVVTSSMLLLWGSAVQRASADQYYDYAVRMVQQRNFKVAAQYLDMRLKSNPNDTYAQYYRALCFHVANQMEEARGLYQSVIANGTDANIKTMAANQLKRIDAVTGSMASATNRFQSGSGTPGAPPPPPDGDDDSSSGPTIVPPNARAYFSISPGGNDMIVDGKINNRGIKFKFDTGAHSIFLGKNHLQQLGIPVPTTKPTGKASGVGGTVDTWSVKSTVTVGGITKKLSLTVAEEYESAPLLGQMFFEDLEYEIDNKGHCIYFRQPQSAAVLDKSDQYAIPFHKKGKHLVVSLEGPKGRKTDILVDTGAYNVMFSKKNMSDLNLDLPGDAEQVGFQGVGGSSTGHKFVVDELRLGPIIMRNIPVVVATEQKGAIGQEGAKEGLLGQEFFSSWRFAVDNKNQRLRFFH